MDAVSICDLYVKRGRDIFHPQEGSRLKRYLPFQYNREALERILGEALKNKLLGESCLRLCVPAFEGKRSEVYVFKTPHHENYRTDRHEKMVTVALATAAAPTYFRPLEHGGYVLVDGGTWANNPIMIGLVEALTAFDVSREQVEIFSIGCGDDPYIVSDAQVEKGGMWHWKDLVFATMRLQSLAATNQARLLLGPPKVLRLDPPTFTPSIALDDCERAVELLAPAAKDAVNTHGDRLTPFFQTPASKYTPVPVPAG